MNTINGPPGNVAKTLNSQDSQNSQATRDELDPLSEENRRLRGLLALTLVAIEGHLNSPDAATEHVLAQQVIYIKEALSRTTERLEPPIS